MLYNVALGTQPNENKQQIFLTLIDDLTPDHIRILHFLDRDYLRLKGLAEDGNLINRLYHAFPELQDQNAYVAMIVATLYGRGLVVGDSPQTADLTNAYPTPMAEEFLAFVRSPLEPTK